MKKGDKVRVLSPFGRFVFEYRKCPCGFGFTNLDYTVSFALDIEKINQINKVGIFRGLTKHVYADDVKWSEVGIACLGSHYVY